LDASTGRFADTSVCSDLNVNEVYASLIADACSVSDGGAIKSFAILFTEA
jgi:hypothetical protein